MADAIFDQVRRIAADAFAVSPASIGERSSPESIESWDSMQHLNFALALEQHFRVSFEPEEIEAMTDIGKACEAVRAKAAAAS